ncbi:AAA family ATPase [Shewanella sp.]|uniref:AAA family ATPase n=1 Tax=Shewanella sp. TaxID=50422 RepID=UPI0026096AC2|nr:AAA family ATPase [Shewanella sp.]
MKNLLLFAKHIALNEKDDEISPQHVAAALWYLSAFVADESNAVFQKLRVQFDATDPTVSALAHRYQHDLSHGLLKTTAEKPVLAFSEAVADLLRVHRPVASGDDWVNNIELFVIPGTAADYFETLKKFEQLKVTLLQEVFGQDHAVEHLIDNMVKGVWQSQQNRPIGVFFFTGPPACGKTFLAERFANHLSEEYYYKAFDMTQYTNANESFGLVGAKKTYDDSAPGQLTTFVKKHPKSIIVFDEFEKAHTQVLLALLRMLSAGFITDEYTEFDVDFRQTIVVFTSNLGSAVYNKQNYLETIDTKPEQARAAMISHLRTETKLERDQLVKAIPPEFLSRLSQGSIILFKSLGVAELVRVAEKQLNTDLKHFMQKSRIDLLPFHQHLVRLLLTSFAPFFDVRDIKSNITAKVIDPVTDFIRANPESTFKQVSVLLSEDISNMLTIETCETQIKALKIRGEVLCFDSTCSICDNQLTLTFSTPSRELLMHVDDMGESGGIVLDMPNIRFNDVAGHDAVKSRLRETLRILHHRDQLEQAGISPPKGMVLFGPPGTGKTTLARALASEAGMPIATCSGNELLSDNFMKELFLRVRKYAPCILFIDEIDALPKRGEAGAKADALMNQLLTEIDGFNQSKEPIFIVAATNRLDKLDEALLRSGRLDLHVHVPFLDKDARRWFIDKFLQYDGYEEDIDVELVVSLTSGMSGADLKRIHREAVLKALSENNNKITQNSLVEEINILKYGAKRSLDNSEKWLAETAYHEAGHAVISHILMPERVIEQISVVPREQALGMVAFSNDQNIDYTKNYWFSQTCVALAGRAAQIKQFGEAGLDTSAGSDLKSAMWSAWSAVAKYGMHPESYNMDVTVLNQWTNEAYFKSHTELLIKQWLDDATTKTDQLVVQYWDQIYMVAQALLDKEVLSEEQFLSLIAQQTYTLAN